MALVLSSHGYVPIGHTACPALVGHKDKDKGKGEIRFPSYFADGERIPLYMILYFLKSLIKYIRIPACYVLPTRFHIFWNCSIDFIQPITTEKNRISFLGFTLGIEILLKLILFFWKGLKGFRALGNYTDFLPGLELFLIWKFTCFHFSSYLIYCIEQEVI